MPGHEGMEVHVHGQVTPARGADGDLKLRSVCDACTSAKLRCNGKTPCERCIKKGIQCHYQPFKHRGAGGSDKTKNKGANNSDEFGDNFLDEYERKTWSVFFTLYRSFSKGCSLYWFKQQLFRMLKFLETKADSDAPAANALLRLKSWMIALGLDVANPPPPCVRNIPRFQFSKTTMVSFQSTLDDLKNDAVRRNLPMLSISEDGAVSVNEAFTAVFEPSQELLQRTLDDAGGGFLPWGGDMLARILSKENDLVLYIQSVSDAIDAIGKPSGIPSIQVVPTMNIVRARKRDGQDVLCIVRGIQRLSFEPESISFSTDIVFELPDSSSGGVQTVPSRARPFSETAMAAMDEMEFNKFLETEPYDVLPLPQDALGGPGDEEWLDSLLDWANETSDGNPVMAMLPVSDEQWH